MFTQDFRYALRALLKHRGFTAIAILTLAIALGANTAIFSVVNAILLRPLPYDAPERLVDLDVYSRIDGDEAPVYSYPNYFDTRQQSRTVEVAAFTRGGAFLMEGAEPELMNGIDASANLLRLLGVRPVLGRLYTDAEDRSGAEPVMLLSHDLWERKFGGDRSIIGRPIRFGTAGRTRTVIGILPPGFRFPAGEDERDFVAPFEEGLDANDRQQRDSIWISVVGKLRPGFTLEQANAELKTIAARLEKQYPTENTGQVYRAKSMHEETVREVRPAVLLLFCAVALVLLIGCANVANLLLARATARQKEISIRAALGASRSAIVRQLLIESVVLSTLAGALGLLLAAWGIDFLLALAPEDIPRLETVALDGNVLLFSLLLSVVTGIVFGLAPALSASRPDLTEALKDATRGSTVGRKANRMRSVLVVAAVSLSLVLLAGAGLLLRSFMNLTGVDPGYNYKNTVELRLSPRAAAYEKQEHVRVFYDRLLASLRATPGVEAVSAASMLPLSQNESVNSFDFVGRPLAAPGREPAAKYVTVMPGFFNAIGIRLLEGRDISPQDTFGKPEVMLVNEAFVREFFPNEKAVGKRLLFNRETGRTAEIVGVVSDVRWRGMATEPPSIMYYAHAQQPGGRAMSVVVRSANPASLVPTLRAAVRQFDREQPIINIEPLIQTRAESLEERRFNLILLGVLAALALVLAGVGIYSVMSYAVTQRTSEIGIRMALGAESGDVFRLVVGQAVKLVAIGLAAGVAIALAGSQLMRSLLYGVTPTDPWTYVAICAVIGTIALVASYVPAARAARVDPLVAIRYD
jgi:putative ABC transport system permease protein